MMDFKRCPLRVAAKEKWPEDMEWVATTASPTLNSRIK